MPGKGERRRPGHFRICGACGKRNKARRAECARCGEPLRGLPEAIPGTRHAPPPPPRKYRWPVAAALVVAVAAGFGVYRVFGTGASVATAPSASSSEAPPVESSTAPAAAATIDPTSAERYAQVRGSVDRAEKALARGDSRGAALLLADAARLVPEDPRIANAYGRALLGIGSRDRALFQFERAARLDTGVVAYRLDYARSLAAAGRARDAAREYEAIAAQDPGNVAASEALARLQPSDPSAGAGTTSIDMGGASSGSAPAPSRGGAFTNEDLGRGTTPARTPAPRAPTPGPSYLPASPIAEASPPLH